MNTPRFHVLEFSPMAIRDTETKDNIHLGSQYEARELCELLNGLCNFVDDAITLHQEYKEQAKQQSLTILRSTGKINFLELEVARLKAELKEQDNEEHF